MLCISLLTTSHLSGKNSKQISDATKIFYDVEDAESHDKIEKVKAKDLIRGRKSLTRDRLKVFLKVATEYREQCLRVTKKAVDKYKLSLVKFEDVHVGKAPVFVSSPLKRVSVTKTSKVKDAKPDKRERVEKKEKSSKPSSKSVLVVSVFLTLERLSCILMHF